MRGSAVGNDYALPEHWAVRRVGCKGPIEFTSYQNVFGVDVGQVFRDQATASHANGLKLTYSLGDYPPEFGSAQMPPKPTGMTIDADTGAISWLAQSQSDPNYGTSAFFAVYATDSNGYTTKKPLVFSVQVCDPPTSWDGGFGACRGPLRITSMQPVYGLDVGQKFSYSVTASDSNVAGLPITFSLINATVAGLSIDPNTGLIDWLATDLSDVGGALSFSIIASDQLGQQDQQDVGLTICSPPLHWNPDGYCG